MFQRGVDRGGPAHRHSDEDHGARVEVAQEGGEVVGGAEGLRGVGGPAVAAGVGRDHLVAYREERHQVVPHAVVGEAAVQQHQRGTGTDVAIGERTVGGLEHEHLCGISHDN